MSYGIAVNTTQILLAGNDDGRMVELDRVANMDRCFQVKEHEMEINSVIVNSCSYLNTSTAELMLQIHLREKRIKMDDIDWILNRIKDPEMTIVVITTDSVYTFSYNEVLGEIARKATDRNKDTVVFYEHATREQREAFEKAVDDNEANLAYAIADLEDTKLFGQYSVQVVQ